MQDWSLDKRAGIRGIIAILLILALRLSTADGEIVKTWFSPKGGATDALIERIDKAEDTILVAAYNFTSKPIADAIIRARGRQVKVTVVLDRKGNSGKNLKRSQAIPCAAAGCKVYLDGRHGIFHHKVIVIDDHWTFLGSFNFTKNAELSNAENLNLDNSPKVAQRYTDELISHVEHADRLEAAK